ncbi:MAG: hypothetical protein E7411_00980 [Ruminococcaceae bacterium]|nr:hypothetical protein [Oscillospiraceae bacterium]
MRRVISFLLSLCVILSSVSYVGVFSADEETVFFDSFENGRGTWIYATTKSNDKNTVIVTDKATDGKCSLYVSDDTEETAYGYRSPKIPATEGATYIVTADLYHVEGTGAKPFLTFYSADGGKLIGKSVTTKKIGEWDSVTLEMEAPAGTDSMIISLMGASATKGESYIDNLKVVKRGGGSVEVKPATPKPSETVLPEGYVFYDDFENGLAGWKHSNNQSIERITEETDLIASGKKAVRITDDEIEKAIGIVSEKFTVKPGETYTAAADMYIVSGTALRIYVKIYDSSNTRITQYSFSSKGRKWVCQNLQFEVPEGGVCADITFSGISTSQGEGVIDNMRISEGKKTLKSDFSNATVESEEEKIFTFNDVYEMPDFKPTTGHPRLYFNKNDIERIKNNVNHPQNKSAYEQFIKEVNDLSNGTIPTKTGNNVNSRFLSVIQSKAFYYAVWGDEEKGKEAVTSLKNFLADANFYDSEYNAQGFAVFTIAAVYDWCYPLISDDDKAYFQNMGLIASSTMEIGFPPVGGSVLNAHAAEAMLQRDQMAFAIAVYDERPDIYKNVAGRYFSEMVDSKKFLAESHSSLFGNSYSTYRYQWEVLSCYMMDALGIKNIYGDEHGKVLYWNLYARRPDGSMLKDGDSVSSNQPMGPYDERGTRAYFLAGNYYKDPYLKGEALRHNNGIIIGDTSSNQNLSSIEVLCFNDPSVEYKTVKELPLSKYFPSPRGEMIARTSWAEGIDAPSVVAQLNIGEYWTQGHDHLDSGEFEIYYKGALANDTGYYQAGRDGSTASNSGNTVSGTVHFYNYQRRTIAHNCMIVFDPNEDKKESYSGHENDGGQIFANKENSNPSVHTMLEGGNNKIGEVLGREFGPDLNTPQYTYIKGDIAKAYGDKVPEYERSFMFLNLGRQDVPAAVLVFDRVVAKDKTFDKSWVLHGLNQPEVNGTRTVFTDTRTGYNGKLSVDTLLPKADNLDIKVIGGKDSEYLVNGTNYWAQELNGKLNEGGGYRIEIGTKQDSEKDYFLNVLQVSDANGTDEPVKAQLIDSLTHTGAALYDRVVLFGKERNRISTDISFSVSGNENYKITVADLCEGTWQVKKDGVDYMMVAVAKEGGVASFEGLNGNYTLSYISNQGEKNFTSNPPSFTYGVNLKLEPANKYIYSDVEPVIENGRTLVPMRAIFEALEADVSWDPDTETATGSKNGNVIKITKDSQKAYVNNKEVTLDVPAKIIDGRFVVPVRFVAESFKIPVEWDSFSKTVIIKTAEKLTGDTYTGEFKPRHEIENALTLYSLTQSGDDGTGNNIENIVDGSFTTGWGVKKDDKGNLGYGIFDLGSVKKVDSVHIAYRMGDSRKYTFSIYASTDGKTFVPVKEKLVSSGVTNDFEKFDLGGVSARYIKYETYGNTTNDWSNMAEMVFAEK